MKKRFLVASLCSCFFLFGCLKDEAINDYSNIKPVILIPNANRPSTAQIGLTTYTQSAGPKELQVYVRLSWEHTLTTDLSITLVRDQEAITSYNNQFNKAFVMLPDAAYTMSNTQAIIKAGQKDAFITLTINPSNVPVSSNYMLAFTISDAQGQTIASNYKTWVIPIKIQ